MSHPLPRMRELIEQGISRGLHRGAQAYVSRKGSLIAELALGESQPGEAMSVETINPWLSSGKPITAAAIAILWERGALDLDDRVARHISEFGVKGKEPITIRHLLTHTGGFRAVIGLKWEDPYDQAIAKICNAPLEPRWIIGQNAGYHASTSWYILGEIVRRIDGRRIDQFAREEIFLPLGMNDCWLSMTPETYRGYGSRIGRLFEMGDHPSKEAPPDDSPEQAAAVRPGASARGPIRELGRFYEMLLGHGSVRLLSKQAIEAMTARHRAGVMDQTFRQIVDMGLGFIVNSAHYGQGIPSYGYGPHASLRTFGHSGQRSSCAYADPDCGLAVAWICNGMAREEQSRLRQHELNEAIYRDLSIQSD